MKALKSTIVFSLGLGLAGMGAVSLPASPITAFQDQGNDQGQDLRGLIDRTQTDLRAAADLEPAGQEQHKRYRKAQHDLSTFDRHLVKGHFDKDKLDDAIGDIQSILDHNTLQATSRDALMRDAEDLRVARARGR